MFYTIKNCCVKIKDYFPLIGIITLLFVAEQQLHNHCINLIISLILFTLLYCMLVYAHINRYMCIIILLILWVMLFQCKKLY